MTRPTMSCKCRREVKAAAERGGAAGFEKATGPWPGKEP